jgi:hypothetical protein
VSFCWPRLRFICRHRTGLAHGADSGESSERAQVKMQGLEIGMSRRTPEENRDRTGSYGVGNHLCGVARAVLLASLRAALSVRRHELKNAVG